MSLTKKKNKEGIKIPGMKEGNFTLNLNDIQRRIEDQNKQLPLFLAALMK